MVSLFPHTATDTSNPILQWRLSVAGMRGDPALVADALMLSRCTYVPDSEESALGLRLQPDRYSASSNGRVGSGSPGAVRALSQCLSGYLHLVTELLAAGTTRIGLTRWFSEQEDLMNIGEAASVSGLSARMIRHYERINLIPPSQRTRCGYRVYCECDVHVLRFIHHARDLGLSIERVRALLALWRERNRSDDEVQAIALSNIDALNARITTLQIMREALSYLAEHCDDAEQPPGLVLDERPHDLPERRAS